MTGYQLDHLARLQAHLATHRQLHQAVQDDDGNVGWQRVDSANPPPLLTIKPQQSAKGYFFAERENLLVFDGERFRETLPTPEPFVLFGVQSCDLTAIAYQDQFFKDDPYYQARRKQALLVGLDCLTPCQQGFCPTVDAGPGVRPATADLVLHQLDSERYLLFAASKKGKDAIAPMQLPPATTEQEAQRNDSLHNCEQAFADDSHLTQGIAKLNAGEVSPQLWQDLGTQCLACSGCTTLCPTCSCYGNQSQQQDGQIQQQRFWDSCLYEGFQREASFHNPAALAGDRVHRFWYHKFSEDFVTEFDRYGCVGCGRCEEVCPGVIGVHSVMKRIQDDG